jgi:hypothetical protein
MPTHPFHRIIGKLIKTEFSNKRYVERNVKVHFDEACGQKGERISLFNHEKKYPFRYCNVDILVFIKNKPKIIIEVEESYVTPGRLFGKFFASGLSDSYQVGDMKEPFRLKNKLLFVQVLDSSKLKEEWKNYDQRGYIEDQIRVFLPRGNIAEYVLLQGEKKSFRAGGSGAKSLKRNIIKFLARNP